MNITPILTLLLLLPTLGVRAEETIDDSTPARALASLTDPKKLATLKGERASNPRLQKCLYWLATARNRGEMPEHVIASANLKNGEQVTPYGTLLSSSLTASLAEADKLGLLSPEGMEELRLGNSATITKGDYAGQEATADHYIPRSVCPELDNQIYNLRLLPSKLNSSKGDKVGEEQVKYAEELNKVGLLSAKGLEAVKKAYEKEVSAQLPQTAESEDEKQARMNEESKQMEIEMVRAEREGKEAVYDLWYKRTQGQAERANKTKSSSDVLIFEKMASATLQAWEAFRLPRFEEQNRNPVHRSLVEQEWREIRNKEKNHIESLIDESLRAK
jgi:hypothetical protein